MIIKGAALDTIINVGRAGVIPFTVKENSMHFLLGIDRRTRELTDLGGGVKCGETLIDTGYREFTEESCKIFQRVVSRETLKMSPAVTNKKRTTAIFFVRVDPMWLDHAETKFCEFQRYLSMNKYLELIGLKWVTFKDFKNVAFNHKNQCMWRRIQNLLRSNTSWDELQTVLLFGLDLTTAIKNSWQCMLTCHNNYRYCWCKGACGSF